VSDRQSTRVDVASCDDCPLYYELDGLRAVAGLDGSAGCEHPDAPAELATSQRALPDKCPLRVRDFTLVARAPGKEAGA
jgi:hypothetical protein